jgi:hypothetical protein
MENPLVLSESYPFVGLGLNHNLDANVKTNIYFDIDINHLASLHFLLPGLRTFDLLSSQPAALIISPPPFRPPRAHILTRLPDVKEALRKDQGHNTARGLGHVRSEDRRTNERQEEVPGQERACGERRHL